MKRKILFEEQLRIPKLNPDPGKKEEESSEMQKLEDGNWNSSLRTHCSHSQLMLPFSFRSIECLSSVSSGTLQYE